MLVRKSRLEVILFDVDGTLTDSLKGAMDSFLFGLAEVDAESITQEEIKAWFGIAANKIFHKLLFDQPERANAGFEAFLRHQQSQINNLTLHHGIDALLAKIQEASIPMGVVTGRYHADLKIMFDHLSLHPLFQVVVSDDQVSKPKPSPEGLLKALSHGKWQASSAVYIGDSATDILAAQSINMPSIAVCWDAHADENALREAGPQALVHSAKELEQVLIEMGALLDHK